jgi:hypothetical protein
MTRGEVMSREDFEDTILFDKMGEYIVNETLVSIQYFRDDLKVGYYNAISGNSETYSGIEVADHILKNLVFTNSPYMDEVHAKL